MKKQQISINIFIKGIICIILSYTAKSRLCAQEYSATIKDSAMVKLIPNRNSDSVYYFDYKKRTAFKLLLAYYDAEKKTPAIELNLVEKGDTIEQEKQWYRNGQLKEERKKFRSINGRIKMKSYSYFSNGKLKHSWIPINEDALITREYYVSGILKSESKYCWNSELKMDEWCFTTEYYENKQLKFTPFNPTEKTKTILFKKYHENGKIQAEYNLSPFGITGKYNVWDKNGNLLVEGYYQDSEKVKDLSERARETVFTQRTGNWSYFDKKGRLLYKEIYVSPGEITEVITY